MCGPLRSFNWGPNVGRFAGKANRSRAIDCSHARLLGIGSRCMGLRRIRIETIAAARRRPIHAKGHIKAWQLHQLQSLGNPRPPKVTIDGHNNLTIPNCNSLPFPEIFHVAKQSYWHVANLSLPGNKCLCSTLQFALAPQLLPSTRRNRSLQILSSNDLLA